MLEHVILKLKVAGFNEIIVNVHHFAEKIISFLDEKDNFGIDIVVSDERDELLDTGGGIYKARNFFNDGRPFLVHNVDILSNIDLKALYNYHLKESPLASMVVSERDTLRYLLFDNENKLHGWTNIKTGEIKPPQLKSVNQFKKLAFSGIHVLSPDIFKLMKNCGNKFSVIDFYLSQADKNLIKGYIPENYIMLDIGKLDVLTQAEQFISEL